MQKADKPKNRLFYIDNIRLCMIIIVVLVHTSVTYSGIGSWYYVEDKSIDTVSKILFAMFNTFSQAYFMGFLFLIAGYFIPAAFDKKGFGKFVKDRFIRLGIPVTIFIFIIHPFMVYLLMKVIINKPVPKITDYYINSIKSFGFLGNTGPLWFAFALLIFSIFYAAIRVFSKQTIRISDYKKQPSHLSIILLILLVSVLNFIVRIFQPFGTEIMNMQLCFFSQYITLFIIGILAYRNNWLTNLSYKFGTFWLKAGLSLGFIIWLLLMLFGGPLAGKEYLILGGLYWQSAVYALWEQLVCAGMCLGLLVIFRDKFNHQGKFVKFLSQNAFGVYVFHAPILVGISLILRNLHLYPLVKFIIVGLITLAAAFTFSSLIRKVPFLKAVFS
ncbi:MAG: acyltransferase family protein [Bacillota bacterium]|nr:acyltransferase family protein [Bacillota bacterium]